MGKKGIGRVSLPDVPAKRPSLLVMAPPGAWPRHLALDTFSVTVAAALPELGPGGAPDCAVIMPTTEALLAALPRLVGELRRHPGCAVVLAGHGGARGLGALFAGGARGLGALLAGDPRGLGALFARGARGLGALLAGHGGGQGLRDLLAGGGAGGGHGLGAVMVAHGFDGFVDVRWPDDLVLACLHTAVRHVQLGRRAAALQRTVIAQVRREAVSLHDLTLRDELTHLHNRRHLMDELQREHERSLKTGHPYAIAFIDLDDLRELNARHGHAAGSQSLMELARVLESCTRATDTPARLGGDEFVVLLAGCDATQAMEFADRFRQRLRAHVFDVDGVPLSTTASIGVAAAACGEHYNDVLKHADQALYRAKALGKDRVVLFEASTAPAHADGAHG